MKSAWWTIVASVVLFTSSPSPACAAMMCVTSLVGAIRKNMTLDALPGAEVVSLDASLQIAACLAPTAVLGGLIGARLTHILPLRVVRTVFVVMLCLGCARMLL